MTRPLRANARARQARTNQAIDLLNNVSANPGDNGEDAEDNKKESSPAAHRRTRAMRDTVTPGNAFAISRLSQTRDENQTRRSARLNPASSLEHKQTPPPHPTDSPVSIPHTTFEEEESDGESENNAEVQLQSTLQSDMEVLIDDTHSNTNLIIEPNTYQEEGEEGNEDDEEGADNDEEDQEAEYDEENHKEGGENEEDQLSQQGEEEIPESQQMQNSVEDSQSEYVPDDGEGSHGSSESHEEMVNANESSSEMHPNTRLVDRIQMPSSFTLQSPNPRRRRRESEDTPRRVRGRYQEPANYRSSLPSTLAQRPGFVEWEANMETGRLPSEDFAILTERTVYDGATKIGQLESVWKALVSECNIVRGIDHGVVGNYKGITDICHHIRESIELYRRIQRGRARGLLNPQNWRIAKRSLEPIRQDADAIRWKIRERANQGKTSTDLRIKASADEYAEQIYKHVVTDLSELALECLKAYYSEEHEWLLEAGFTAVVEILVIAGTINKTLESLKKCKLIYVSRNISRYTPRLRIIYDTLRQCEWEDQNRQR